jgi:hypothetical protein
MKKFLLTGRASTPSRLFRDVPSVKGIYTALFILILTAPVFSQIEMKDNNTVVSSPKWEIGFDLKPLFQKDESYNMLAKWHFTEKKAIRLRIGSGSSTSSADSIWLFNQDIIRTGVSKLQYSENYPKLDKKIGGQFSVGYQYSFIKRQVCFYTATEFNYEQIRNDFNTFGGSRGYANSNLYDSLKSNIFYNKNTLSYLKYRIRTYGVSQMVGIGYKFNHNLSVSSEFAISYYKTSHYLSKSEFLPPNSSAVLETSSELTSSGTNKGFLIKPLLGLYLNYHF